MHRSGDRKIVMCGPCNNDMSFGPQNSIQCISPHVIRSVNRQKSETANPKPQLKSTYHHSPLANLMFSSWHSSNSGSGWPCSFLRSTADICELFRENDSVNNNHKKSTLSYLCVSLHAHVHVCAHKHICAHI